MWVPLGIPRLSSHIVPRTQKKYATIQNRIPPFPQIVPPDIVAPDMVPPDMVPPKKKWGWKKIGILFNRKKNKFFSIEKKGILFNWIKLGIPLNRKIREFFLIEKIGILFNWTRYGYTRYGSTRYGSTRYGFHQIGGSNFLDIYKFKVRTLKEWLRNISSRQKCKVISQKIWGY